MFKCLALLSEEKSQTSGKHFMQIGKINQNRHANEENKP